MRISFVTETFPPDLNGVAMSVSRAIEGLRARGHQVELVRPRQAHERCRESAGELRTPGLPIPMYRDLRIGLPVVHTLAARWTDECPDLVHVATPGPLGWAAIRAARMARVPVTSDFRTDFERYSEHYGLGWCRILIGNYLRRFHNGTDLTFVPTPQLRSRLTTQGYRRLEVIGRGVDARLYSPHRRSEALRRQWSAGSDDPVALYVGRVAAEKNIDLALRAYEAMRQRNARAKLVVVGDGPLRARLRQQAPTAIFVGRQEGAQLAAYYASADIFLFPSLTDTFGNVVLEALASGLAVVAFRAGAAEVHVTDSINGVLAELGDELDFIACACAVMQQFSRLDPLRKAARETAEAVSWSAVTGRFESCLTEVARAIQAPLHRACPA